MATCDYMAEALSKLLACEIRVVRDRQPPNSFQSMRGYSNALEYWVVVTKGEWSHKFGKFRSHSDVARSLAMIADLIQMGFVKSEENI